MKKEDVQNVASTPVNSPIYPLTEYISETANI